MHPRILAQRTAVANERLVVASRKLAALIELPDGLVNALTPATNNSQVRPMLVMEACADLMDAAVAAVAMASIPVVMQAQINGQDVEVVTAPDESVLTESKKAQTLNRKAAK